MARKKKVVEEEVVTTKQVKMYKVCVPFWYAFGSQEIELAKFYNETSAKEYIDSYFNPFVKPFLFIKEKEISVKETD